jgi:hypothetical protein
MTTMKLGPTCNVEIAYSANSVSREPTDDEYTFGASTYSFIGYDRPISSVGERTL